MRNTKNPLEAVPFVWLDPRLDLPNWLLAGIGRIAAEWAYLETELEETIRVLHDTNVKLARIAVTGMNVRSRVMCILSLLQAHGLLLQSREFTKLGKTLTDDRQPERDKVAHGLWARDSGEWFLLRSSGARTITDLGRVTRATLPQRELINRSVLSEIHLRIRAAHHEIAAFRKGLVVLLPPSLHKSPRQLSQHYRRLARTKKAQ